MKFLRRTLIKIAGAGPAGKWTSAMGFKADDPIYVQQNADEIKARSQGEIIAESRRIAPILSDIVASVGRALKPGDTSQQINDRLVVELTKNSLAAAMSGYEGFPAASAISVDPEFLNAPPNNTPIKEGSIVTIELSGSTSCAYASQGWTFPIGSVSDRKRDLLAAAQAGLIAGISAIDGGVTPRQIGRAIGQAVADCGFSTVQEFCGFGMGQKRIQEPHILNYDAGSNDAIPTGTILNIYVIAKSGTPKLKVLANGAVIGRDGECGAVATAMVAIEPDGKSVLTNFPSWDVSSPPSTQ